MSERVTMPALGESVTEGTVTRWLKNVGDTVAVDEPLLEVSTDKVDTEIPSPVAGVLQEILAQEDDTVPVGADLAVIGDGAEGSGGDDQPAQQDGGQDEQQDQQQDQQAARTASRTQQAAEAPAAEAPSTEQEPQAATSEPEQAQASGDQDAVGPGRVRLPPAPTPAAGSGGDSGGSGETVTMPALGESVTEGTVTRWLKAEGDSVEVDEPLLEVSTDKVDTEIPSPVAGTLTKILVQEDDTVPVGGDLAVIGGSGGGSAPAQEAPAAGGPGGGGPGPGGASRRRPPPQEAPAAGGTRPRRHRQRRRRRPQPAPRRHRRSGRAARRLAAAPRPPAPAAASSDETDASAYVTPLVRKLAADNKVDLGSLKGTGVGGRIRKQDVLDAAKAAQEAAAAPARGTRRRCGCRRGSAAPRQPSGGARRPSRPSAAPPRRCRGCARPSPSGWSSRCRSRPSSPPWSRSTSPRSRACGPRPSREFEQREGTKLSFLPFFALAAVEALKAHPSVNSSVEGTEVTYHGTENLGVAVDTERGLLVPVIKDAGDLNIAGLARKIADLAERTRTNKIGPDELGGGTFTLTNTGSRGALFDTPIINQPNVAILGTGAVVKRPVVVSDGDGGETIAVRSMVYLALSYDHRVVDGADAARFLTTMKTRLEEGNFESDLGL